jgi:hypothetical protein
MVTVPDNGPRKGIVP